VLCLFLLADAVVCLLVVHSSYLDSVCISIVCGELLCSLSLLAFYLEGSNLSSCLSRTQRLCARVYAGCLVVGVCVVPCVRGHSSLYVLLLIPAILICTIGVSVFVWVTNSRDEASTMRQAQRMGRDVGAAMGVFVTSLPASTRRYVTEAGQNKPCGSGTPSPRGDGTQSPHTDTAPKAVGNSPQKAGRVDRVAETPSDGMVSAVVQECHLEGEREGRSGGVERNVDRGDIEVGESTAEPRAGPKAAAAAEAGTGTEAQGGRGREGQDTQSVTGGASTLLQNHTTGLITTQRDTVIAFLGVVAQADQVPAAAYVREVSALAAHDAELVEAAGLRVSDIYRIEAGVVAYLNFEARRARLMKVIDEFTEFADSEYHRDRAERQQNPRTTGETEQSQFKDLGYCTVPKSIGDLVMAAESEADLSTVVGYLLAWHYPAIHKMRDATEMETKRQALRRKMIAEGELLDDTEEDRPKTYPQTYKLASLVTGVGVLDQTYGKFKHVGEQDIVDDLRLYIESFMGDHSAIEERLTLSYSAALPFDSPILPPEQYMFAMTHQGRTVEETAQEDYDNIYNEILESGTEEEARLDAEEERLNKLEEYSKTSERWQTHVIALAAQLVGAHPAFVSRVFNLYCAEATVDTSPTERGTSVITPSHALAGVKKISQRRALWYSRWFCPTDWRDHFLCMSHGQQNDLLRVDISKGLSQTAEETVQALFTSELEEDTPLNRAWTQFR
ncbi:hypothetical protein KIPB_009849, partial [Kipferlia bialata]